MKVNFKTSFIKSMRYPFVPKDFNAPESALLGDNVLFPITTKDAMEDWLVLTSNSEIISKTRGGGSTESWPFKYSLEDNYKDLAWLELCAKSHQMFCYIVRRKDTNVYAGCVYIYPIEIFYPQKAENYDVDFSCWVTQKEFNEGNYDKVFMGLYKWLYTSWPFSRERIFLRNDLKPKELEAK